MRKTRMSLPIMWPPSTPISAAILPCAWARRTSSAVRQNTRSFEFLRTFSCTASIWSSAFCTAGGPIVRPSIQMEKKIAFIPPSRMRGISTCPSGFRVPISKSLEKKRCVVSSCVSRTREEKWSFFARSAMSSAETRRERTRPAHKNELTHKKTRTRRIDFPQYADCGESLPYKPSEKRLFPHVAVHFGDGLGEGYALGASLHAVLRVGAFLDAAGSHERAEPFALIHCARRVHIEKAHLADDGRAYELIMAIHLRADLEAVPASDAIRKRIAFFLNFRRYARAFAEIVSAIDGNPRLHALEALKHKLAVDREVAHQRKLGHRLDSNWLLKLIHQRRTSHARFSIDQHRARSADLLQALRIVGDRCGLLAVAHHGILRDIAQANDDIHRGPPLERKFLPTRGFFRPGLPLYFDDDLFCFCHNPSTRTRLTPEGLS